MRRLRCGKWCAPNLCGCEPQLSDNGADASGHRRQSERGHGRPAGSSRACDVCSQRDARTVVGCDLFEGLRGAASSSLRKNRYGERLNLCTLQRSGREKMCGYAIWGPGCLFSYTVREQSMEQHGIPCHVRRRHDALFLFTSSAPRQSDGCCAQASYGDVDRAVVVCTKRCVPWHLRRRRPYLRQAFAFAFSLVRHVGPQDLQDGVQGIAILVEATSNLGRPPLPRKSTGDVWFDADPFVRALGENVQAVGYRGTHR